MSLSDFIADSLTRIRNAQKARHLTVNLPYSKMVHSILSVLCEEGYVKDIEKIENASGFGELVVTLKYTDDGNPVIQTIKRVSKPGRRIYSQIKTLSFVANGLGLSILTTNKGIMTDVNARKHGVGGEIICQIF
jgi:small subunit ribosomal protein S8